jgi:arsenate reductase
MSAELSSLQLRARIHVIITMGCGDACPIFPGKRYEDWKLDYPAGRGVDAVRPIRDEIRTRIEALLADLIPAA